jgi:hypothetical protein
MQKVQRVIQKQSHSQSQNSRVIINVKGGPADSGNCLFLLPETKLLQSGMVYIDVIPKKQIMLSWVLLSGTMVYSQQHTHILYQVDFEARSLPSFLTTQSSTHYALQIVEKPVYQGKKAARFELRDSDPENNNGTRTEILFPGPVNNSNPERWYAFAVFFPGDNFNFDNSDDVISQWHQGGKATPSLCIRTKADRIKLRIKSRIDSKEWVDLGSIEKNAWQYYVIHVKHSSGADGLVEIWRNGVKLVNHAGANMYDLSNGVFHMPKWKLGIYKSDWNGSSVTKARKRVLYFDAIKIGDAKASYADMTADPADSRASQNNKSSARK